MRFNGVWFSSGERGRGRPRQQLCVSSLHAGFQQPWEAHLPCLPGENNIVSPVLIEYRTMKTKLLQVFYCSWFVGRSSLSEALSSFQHQFFSEMQVTGKGVDMYGPIYCLLCHVPAHKNKLTYLPKTKVDLQDNTSCQKLDSVPYILMIIIYLLMVRYYSCSL